MNKIYYGLAVLLIALAAGVAVLVLPGPVAAPVTINTPVTTEPASKDDLIVVTSPLPGEAIGSPLNITGKARGTWYFEASFPVELRNASGTVIAQGPAQATGDWMTADYVPFTLALSYPAQPAGSQGTLVLKKDNPSGLPQNDNQLVIPVVF